MSFRIGERAARIGRFFRWILRPERLEPLAGEATPEVAERRFFRMLVAREPLPLGGEDPDGTDPDREDPAGEAPAGERGWVRGLLGRDSLAREESTPVAPAGRRSFLGALVERETLGRDEPTPDAPDRRRFLALLVARERLGPDEPTAGPPEQDNPSNSRGQH